MEEKLCRTNEETVAREYFLGDFVNFAKQCPDGTP